VLSRSLPHDDWFAGPEELNRIPVPPSSVPEALEVPAVRPAVLVQIDHCSPLCFNAPVLAVGAVLPPSPLDPPPPYDVGDLVPPVPPQEGRRHPGISLNHDVFVVALRHAATAGNQLWEYSNVCSIILTHQAAGCQVLVLLIGDGFAAEVTVEALLLSPEHLLAR